MNNEVRFHPDIQVVEVLSIDDYTPREVAAAWYSEEEMEKITNRALKVIQSMMDGGRGRKYCIRGLEGHSKLGSITRKRNRTAAMAAVLMEQAQQWVENSFDDQAIANAYQRTTSSCRMWAQVMGNKDRQVADAVLFQDEEEYMEELRTAAAEWNESKKRTLNKSEERTFPSNFKSSNPNNLRSAQRLSPAILRSTPAILRSTRTARLVAVH